MPKAGSAGASRRQHLLEVAAALVIKKGTARLTLDAVSEAAHFSKGGLLYYFDSKASLLEGLVDDLTGRLQAQVCREAENCAGRSGSLQQARAYLRAVAQMGELPPCEQHAKALTAICTTDPDLVQRVQQRLNICTRGEAVRSAAVDPDDLEALHLRLVADGLWLADLFGCYAIDSEQRGKLLEKLGV